MSKIVKIPVWDLETDTIIEVEIEQEALDAMDTADKEVELRRQIIDEKENDTWTYTRDD